MKSILLVEDNADDAFFMKRACHNAALQNPLIVVEDGLSALRLLQESLEERSKGDLLPGMIFLDVNLPGKSGLEVLRWIREQPGLKSLPVIVLTSSDNSIDNHRALSQGASAVVVKPPTVDKLRRLKQDLHLASEEFAEAAPAGRR